MKRLVLLLLLCLPAGADTFTLTYGSATVSHWSSSDAGAIDFYFYNSDTSLSGTASEMGHGPGDICGRSTGCDPDTPIFTAITQYQFYGNLTHNGISTAYVGSLEGFSCSITASAPGPGTEHLQRYLHHCSMSCLLWNPCRPNNWRYFGDDQHQCKRDVFRADLLLLES
jgi:hypothetical protein